MITMTQKEYETDRKLQEVFQQMNGLPIDKRIDIFIAAKLWMMSQQIACGTLDSLHAQAEPQKRAI